MGKPPLESELLQGAPLRYAPDNEMGVVFLFAHLSRRMQVHVESVQAGFPDCIALQRVGGKEKRIRIEFEYRSSNFRAHGHPADGCDWIVCWEHDWPEAPANLRVVELRDYFGHGFNVWVDIGGPHDEWPVRGTHNFGKRVSKGDLVFFYEAWPRKWLRHVYAVAGPAPPAKRGQQPGPKAIRKNYEFQGDPVFGTPGHRYAQVLRRVCVLEPPLLVKQLETRSLTVVKDAIFSQKHNRRITEHWWLLHDLLIRKYPDLADAFEPFSPSRL